VGLPAAAEREVADPLPIEVGPADARAVLGSVPFWLHTFALNGADGLYTPGRGTGPPLPHPGAAHGTGHRLAPAVFYVALSVWAYEEALHGDNWFRRLLGLGLSGYVIVTLTQALHA